MRREELMSQFSILVACLVLAAAPAAAQSKATIQKLGDQWAAYFNKGDAAGLASMYTEDAYVLPPGADMVKGRSAIEAFWRQQMQQAEGFKCTTVDVKPLGSRSAREIGTCSFRTKGQQPQQGSIKYAVVWEKGGSQWRLLQDIWNTGK